MNRSDVKILAIDDSSSIRQYLRWMLGDHYHLALAASGEEGLALYRRERPDVIILDMNMPGLDGLEVIRRLRQGERDEDVFIIVLTADDGRQAKTRALNGGANDFLIKPVDQDELLARLGVASRQVHLNRKLRQAYDAIAAEMDLVASLQRRLLPGASPRLAGVKIGSLYQPSGRASGDYFDFFPVGEGRLRCAVADVSGRGARAAFIMAIVRTLLRLTQRDYHDLPETLAMVNAQLCQILGKESDFVTIFAADIDLTRQTLEYVNAGHCPGVLRRAGGDAEILGATAPLLGFFDIDFQSRVLDLAGPARLLLYTDGFYEWECQPGEVFGVERFLDLAGRVLARGGPALDDVLAEITSAHGRQPLFRDDLTALWIELES